jgi:hypothetical protein
MINIADAKAKIETMKLPDYLASDLSLVLERKLILAPPNIGKATVNFIESQLFELGYLAKDQVNGIWGTSTDTAFGKLCKNNSIKWEPKAVIGQTCLLALLNTSKPISAGIDLPVPYYSQRDSETGHAWRMCFSSSCAMVLSYLKPIGVLTGPNGDDQYLKRVLTFGDTTEHHAQVKALRSFGVNATMHYDLTEQDLLAQLQKKRPVPIGILHHGPSSAPVGGGHWIVVKGITADGQSYIVHDPFGDLDLVNGGYPGSANGKDLLYSKQNLIPRWRVNGSGGWGIIA